MADEHPRGDDDPLMRESFHEVPILQPTAIFLSHGGTLYVPNIRQSVEYPAGSNIIPNDVAAQNVLVGTVPPYQMNYYLSHGGTVQRPNQLQEPLLPGTLVIPTRPPATEGLYPQPPHGQLPMSFMGVGAPRHRPLVGPPGQPRLPPGPRILGEDIGVRHPGNHFVCGMRFPEGRPLQTDAIANRLEEITQAIIREIVRRGGREELRVRGVVEQISVRASETLFGEMEFSIWVPANGTPTLQTWMHLEYVRATSNVHRNQHFTRGTSRSITRRLRRAALNVNG